MAYSDLDDVDYLVEDNAMDEFAYHRKWKRPMVEWHIGGASWEQNANDGNDLVTWKRLNNRELSHYWNGYSITEETESAIQLMPTINLALVRALKNLSNSIIIKVLPTSVSRMLTTQHTTMTNSDGRCRCKGG